MIQKQPININFGQGINTKTDPWQLPIGQFLLLENSIFDTQGLLKKRNGYANLPDLPDTTYSYLTTFNDNLTALGPNIAALSETSMTWISKGSIEPLKLNTLPLIRNSLNQVQCDAVVSDNGLVCTVYSELNGATTVYKYAIADAVTGQNIVAPTLIPVSSGTVTGSPRVFELGNYFVVVFTNVITAVSHLQYIAISKQHTSIVTTNQDIAAVYTPTSTVGWDGLVCNNNLYIAYNTTSGGQAIKITYLSTPAAALGQVPVTPVSFSTFKANVMSLCIDETTNNPLIYVSFYATSSTSGYTLGIDLGLNTVFAPAQIISTGTILNITSAAQNGSCTVFYEVSNSYSYDALIATNYVSGISVSSTGTVGSPYISIRSLGLASKAFIIDEKIYYLGAFSSPYQPSYFLINGSTSRSSAPVIVSKLAYENGGGYLTLGLPIVSVSDNSAKIAYLFKDLVLALNTNNNSQQTTSGGVYAQTGINLVTFDFTKEGISTSEIGNNLHLSGGFLGMYDGYLPVEHNFFLWPDSVEVVGINTAGGLTAQQYYYQAIYQWSDNQGNQHMSAPSIPVTFTIVAAPANFTGNRTSGSPTIAAVSSFSGLQVGQPISGTGIPANTYILSLNTGASTLTMSQNASSGSATSTTITPTTLASLNVSVPTLRLTMKTANPVKIVIYRWSTANQVYYQVTSITAPTLNDTTIDSVTFTDSLADSAIVGNSIIYTNGGVIENVNAPATNIMTLFDTRLWLVDAEDQNLLWYSKQVIEATPVEMSDLLTYFVAPNTGTTATTGPITALAPMDDKLIIFKRDAIYYINGAGPDNTGSNNQYSQPVFVTSTVGCTDQASVVLMNDGLMFQSDKGIWLLNRNLAVSYIGANVEGFNQSLVNSGNNIPETNQVRLTLDTGQTLMYDYYYQQWGTFVGVPAISSTIYENLHTFINRYGQVFQETTGVYLDGTRPVLLSFQTSWINFAALQGYERFYYFYFLGKYYSPHKLDIGLSYNYVDSIFHNSIITPVNFSSPVASPYGDQPSPFGSPVDLEQWKIHAKIQKCQSFKITMKEIYDPSLGVVAGAGLTLSGLNMIVAVKRGTRPIRASNTAG